MVFTTTDDHQNSTFNPIAKNLFSISKRGFLYQNGYFNSFF